MADPALLAIDWGTTNRRTFMLDTTGTVLATRRDDRGVLAIPAGGYPAELAMLRQQFGPLPVLAAGMVGSSRGWAEAAYVPAPAGTAELAAGLTRIADADVAIVPGVSLVAGGRADVMRGEEVQVLGAMLAGLAPPDGLFCQPGTHNKWITLANREIVDFRTAMTGELFALLRDHSILAEMMTGPVADGAAFRRGVAEAAGGTDLLSALFGVRAGALLGTLARSDTAAFASGLLIGSDVAAHGLHGGDIHILASGTLAALYAATIDELGGRSHTIDNEAAFVAGIHHLWEIAR